MKKEEYTADDIEVLSDRDHVRKRLPVYAGNKEMTTYKVPFFTDDKKIIFKEVSFIPAAFKCVNEIIDNSIDEFTQIDKKNKILTIIYNNGIFTIRDNGRGVPIDKHKVGLYTPEVVFSQLRSGRNFSDNKEAGVIGQNGMGSAITNFCSEYFKVKIWRDGKQYIQTFEDGTLKKSKPSIRKNTTHDTGTEIEFKLDPAVFGLGELVFDEEFIENRAKEIALTNPDITVIFKTGSKTKKFKFKNGFKDILNNYESYYFEDELYKFAVVFNADNIDVNGEIYSWVNSFLLYDGGICNTQITNAFVDKTISHLKSKNKGSKIKIERSDVLYNLLIVSNLKISDPQYDAQSKTRLTGPSLRKEYDAIINAAWNSFSRKNKKWFDDVKTRAEERYHYKNNKKAINELEKKLNKKRIVIPALVDAVSKNRDECYLLITEGDSASSSITEARNPNTIASLHLQGKINNVYGVTPAQLLKMEKINDLLTAIGLIPGKRANNLKYGKIVIATDADFDGAHITTLLVNLFYRFWPELFGDKNNAFINRLAVPNICLTKKDKRIYFQTKDEYLKQKHRYKGYTASYYKGLGSMEFADWELILSNIDDYLIPIYDDGNLHDILDLMFGDDADLRKEWLSGKNNE